MDFLDPKKQKYHRIQLLIGYGLISIAVVLTSLILVYLSAGFRITREGRVIQNGLVFVSSQPSDAAIFTNGEPSGRSTGARLSLPAGQYTFELKREGYRDWRRGITVEGGSVQRFDYPLLFPVDLRTTSLKDYEQPMRITAQSPDRRWLLTHTEGNSFDLFDLSSRNPAATPLSVPDEILSANTTTTGWQEADWADDNRRMVLQRLFEQDGGQRGSEYILLDHEEPSRSRNLTVLLGFNPDQLQLRDHKHDRYWAFDEGAHILFTASLDEPTPRPFIRNVVAFAADGPDTVLYATNQDADEDRTIVNLRRGEDSYILREMPRDETYLLGLARYRGTWLAAAGAQTEDRVYVYKNPLNALRAGRVAAPVQILRTERPEQVVFSPNARFVASSRGANLAVFDAETDRGYAYEVDVPEGGAIGRVSWMDGFRLTANIQNELAVLDFDGTNQHTLVPLRNNTTAPVFNPSYTFMYTLSAQNSLERTSLLTPEDE